MGVGVDVGVGLGVDVGVGMGCDYRRPTRHHYQHSRVLRTRPDRSRIDCQMVLLNERRTIPIETRTDESVSILEAIFDSLGSHPDSLTGVDVVEGSLGSVGPDDSEGVDAVVVAESDVMNPTVL